MGMELLAGAVVGHSETGSFKKDGPDCHSDPMLISLGEVVNPLVCDLSCGVDGAHQFFPVHMR